MAVKEKPGVMFYFKTGEAIKDLDYETKGRLFDCIMEYGQFGTVPELSGALAFIWPFVKQRIDDDSERYAEIQKERVKSGSNGGKAKARNAKQAVANATIATENIASLSTSKQNCPNTNTDTNTDTEPNNYTIGAFSGPTIIRQHFVPPSADDVRAYANEKGYTINPDAFVDYYSANGWKVGKNSMKDWKAAVRTWTRKENNNGRTTNLNWKSKGSENAPIRIQQCYEL